MTKSGFMRKQGGRFKTWHRQWFTLVGKELIYFKEKNGQPKGRIAISDPQLVELAPECRKKYAFRINDPHKRVFYIATDSAEETNSWLDELRKAAAGTAGRLSVSWQDFESVSNLHRCDRYAVDVVRVTSDGQQYVMKRYTRSSFNDWGPILEPKTSLLQLIHPFVTRLLYIVQGRDEVGLVYEYIPHGSLFSYLWEEGKFSESRTRLYAAEIFLGLVFLHQRRVNYGDLCPDCVLVAEDGHIKLPDPGLIPPKPAKTEYLAPEVWAGKLLTSAADWYSLGALVYEMLCGSPPFWAEKEDDLEKLVLHEPVRFPHHVSKTARDFVVRLLAKDPAARLAGDDIREHAFFAGIVWADVQSKAVTPELIPDSCAEKKLAEVDSV